MSSDVERYVSPEGQRIILHDPVTGEWWYAYKLMDAAAEDARVAATRWRRAPGTRMDHRADAMPHAPLGLPQLGPRLVRD